MDKEQVIEIIKKDFKGKAFRNDNRFGGISCLYRTDDGKKCAIGLFIPEGHIGQLYLGGVDELLEEYPDLKDYMPSDREELLIDFQQIHDGLSDHLSVNAQKAKLIKWVNNNWV